MTDLEDAWNDFPTGQPPVTAIVSQGRDTLRDRRRRPLQVVGIAAALTAAFSAGLVIDGVGGTGSNGGNPAASDALRPVAFRADLEPAASCDVLLAPYHERGIDAVTAYGWDGHWRFAGDVGFLSDAAAARVDGLAAQASSPSGTNVQESGVDEPDVAKTDGRLVVRMRGNELQVYDVTGDEPQKLGGVRLSRLLDGELLLHGDSVVVIGRDATVGSRVIHVSIDDPTRPTIVASTTYSSRIVSARQHDDTVRLVLSQDLPALDFVNPETDNLTQKQALRRNRETVESTTIDDWLPHYTTDAGPDHLVDCNQVAVPAGEPPLGTTAVVGVSFDQPEPSAIALAGAVNLAYSSTERLYLADSPTWGCFDCFFDARRLPRSGDQKTHLYEFEFDGVNAIHVASGEVDGVVADRWSMDEVDGVLRLAVATPGGSHPDNAVVTVRRTGQRLDEIGRVDGIGVDEQIKGVRWFDHLAVVVTFRTVDPLYTIDLTDPADPQLLGELKIPGFSDYLHPVGDDLLLGVGYTGASQRDVKLSLYDVSDPSAVKEIDTVVFDRQQALATTDPRTFTWLPKTDTALTVVARDHQVSIAQVHVDGRQLTQRTVRISNPGPSSEVRTLPLPDGRVVLATGNDVAFFDLD